MKLYTSMLLVGMLTLSLQGQAQNHYESVQIPLGTLLPTDSVRVYIEYPEYEQLHASDIKKLKAKGFEPQTDVQFHIRKSVMRGETYADVTFVPVVKRNGKWLKLSNYELKYDNVGQKLSPAMRGMVQAAMQMDKTKRYAEHSVLAQGKWVKIRVKHEGIYQLTDAQLQKMGFSDPSRVKLYGYGGRLLPEDFTFEGKDALIDDLNEVSLYRRKGSSLFYADGVTTFNTTSRFKQNTFSRYSYYFLTEGDDPAAFATLPAPESHCTDVHQVSATALYDNDAFMWYGGGREFYDSKDTQQGGQSYKLSLPGHVGGKCRVFFDISAQNAVSHTEAVFTLSHSDKTFKYSISKLAEGESARGYRGSFVADLENEAVFRVRTTSTGRLNYLYTVYNQTLSAAYSTQAFTAGVTGNVQLNVAGADGNTRVWQIGTASQPAAELPGVLEGDFYKAKASDGQNRFVLVDISKNYETPEFVANIANQDLHADASLDYIIIVPASGKLTEQAERLAEAHSSRNNLRTKVVRADQVFNEFSSGTPDATAYRRYLKMLYDKALTPEDMPKYLLLFGDCAYDNRMITSEWRGGNPDDYLLAYEASDHDRYKDSGYSIGTLHTYVSDDYYALLDDGEGHYIETEKIDLGVGRFVCHTPEKAKWLVDQAISYMNQERVGSWKNRMWAIGDVGDENAHMEDAISVAEQAKSVNDKLLQRYLFPDVYTITQGAQGATYPEATQKLKTSMQQGALIFNYNGHGRPDRLSHQFVLRDKDMSVNISQSRPLWIFASCEISPFDQPIEDMARNILYAPEGSAIAAVCASRSVYAARNLYLNKGYLKYVLGKDKNGKRYTMGDAMRLTKCELVESSNNTIGEDNTINKMKYVLLGDPALTLAYPDPGIVVDSINGKPLSGDGLIDLPIGGVVRFSGYVNADSHAQHPDKQFNGTLTGTVFAPKQNLVCKGYKNKYEDPLMYSDYTRMLFEGSVEVKDGRFSLEFMVPRGISFSKDKALLSLYAVNKDRTQELNGSYENFCLNGSAVVENIDSVGPSVYTYINTPDFVDGGVVGTDATFYASIADSTAISMLSGNLGHDMELWMDSDPSTTMIVNDFFTFDYGSYQKGHVAYPLKNLTPGIHSLNFRVWDVFDNSTLSTLTFRVSEGGVPDFDVLATIDAPTVSTRFITTFQANDQAETLVTTEVYNVAGMRVWHQVNKVSAGSRYAAVDWNLTDYAGNLLEPGVYLYRSKVGKRETKTKKMVIR